MKSQRLKKYREKVEEYFDGIGNEPAGDDLPDPKDKVMIIGEDRSFRSTGEFPGYMGENKPQSFKSKLITAVAVATGIFFYDKFLKHRF